MKTERTESERFRKERKRWRGKEGASKFEANPTVTRNSDRVKRAQYTVWLH